MGNQIISKDLFHLSRPSQGYDWVNLTKEEAASEILSDDGSRYEMRRADGGWWLWGKRNAGWPEKIAFSSELDEKDAEADCLRAVIDKQLHHDGWFIQPMSNFLDELKNQIIELANEDDEDAKRLKEIVRGKLANAADPLKTGII